MADKFFKLQVDNGTNFVLQVRGENVQPMAKVIVDQKRETKDDNQWWSYDVKTNTLRTKDGGLCLDIDSEGNLRVNPFCEHGWTQKFAFHVQSVEDKGEVLQIVPANPDGETANTEDYKSGNHQQLWAYESKNADKEQGRYFFELKSTSGHTSLLKIGGKTAEAKTIVEKELKGNQDGQLWWYNPAQKTIQCKSNEYALESQKEFTWGSDESVVTNTLIKESTRQQWRFMLASTKDKGLVEGGSDAQSPVTMTSFKWKNNDIAFKIVH